MDPKGRKLMLEIYGLVRMSLGVAELVGLSAAYFFLEFVVKYPREARIYLVDEEIVVFVCLSVLLRCVFHIVTGVGIARVRQWGRIWLMWGWPLMLVITFGVTYSCAHDWINAGYVNGLGDVIHWPKMLIYTLWIGWDIFFVCPLINEFHQNISWEKELDERMDPKRIAIVFFAVLAFFCVLIFLGRPIKQGFHQGFYKTKGDRSTTAKPRQSLSRTSGGKTSDSSAKPVQAVAEKSAAADTKILLPQKIKAEMKKIEENDSARETHIIEKKESGKKAEGMPYRGMVGLFGAILIITGLLIQLVEMQSKSLTAVSYTVFALGFLFLLIYGLSMKELPVSVMGFLAGILCVVIVALKIKGD